MGVKSFQNYATAPSAIISDGIVTIPLWAVSTLSLSESYHLPPIGSSSARALVATHDDTVSLSGILIGPERFAWKLTLETLAESSKRGSGISAFTGGKFSGLILITSMTIRTDMQIQSLTFSATAAAGCAGQAARCCQHRDRGSGRLGREEIRCQCHLFISRAI
jgi:hypothetical protein